MIALSLAEIAEVTGGEVHGDPDLVVDGAAYVDTRSPVEGGLFVAIVGERTDGHSYAEGAHAVLGSRPTAAPTVVVADPTAALGRLARHVVDRLDVTVLALTGSQGKTGTKDLLAHVLAQSGPTVATAANNNNELGVPLTVLRADVTTRYLVLEMGARGIGHIAYLAGIAPPSIAAVLNVGTAHIGEFGGREAIAEAKGELVESLPSDGTAVLNADDTLVAAMATRTDARVLSFGESGDVRWRGSEADDLGRASFDLGHLGEWAPVRLQQTGARQVLNAAAAAALALAAGLALDDVAAALSTATPASRWRMELTERSDGLLVLNDAYNANPDSMRAALEALAGLGRSRSGRTIAVLGEMRELGGDHDSGHLEVGHAAVHAGIDVVVVVGDGASGIADGAREGGCEVIVTAGHYDTAAWVRNNAGADDVVLVKASRAAALEQVAERVLNDLTDQSTPSERNPTAP
ncbi:UDP-N-acetylmuramoyl-tripeptide--D-alanyl-D-alanine ligase [Nocardioides sp.]|uniref:UDP-N-acetylmuramoyl-tripeptide--D-alanyl-D- alanine ligase n=1 Tax=Nocardioides sp. TaxID=35761 RepID=UPI002B273071|nr:UDP-N-acetylmuramoyl-tripeptide--D-alanyl-D-alanine ligase [Nocardioides sp.]